jgi:hypothetical protein
MTCAARPAFPVDAEVRAIGALYPSAAMTYDGAVAPRVGAWIETVTPAGLVTGVSSPPAWGRGSKHPNRPFADALLGRPPRGGVDRNSFFRLCPTH